MQIRSSHECKAEPLVNDLPKILWLPADTSGCGYVRMRLPANKLHKHGLAECVIFDKGANIPGGPYAAVEIADIIVFQRPAKPAMAKMVRKAKEAGKKVVIDIDDNLWCLDPLSAHYDCYGVEEVYCTDEKGVEFCLWRDKMVDSKGCVRFDIEKNREKLSAFAEALSYADLVTVTTEEMREWYLQFNPNVKVLPNCIDFKIWKPTRVIKPEGEVRIGLTGGASHYSDWIEIQGVLKRIADKYPQVKFVFQGQWFPGLTKGVHSKRLIKEPWVNTYAYPYLLQTLGIDIAIIPIKDTPFSRYKSPHKWLEFSAMKVPCVVSDLIPYNKVAVDDDTALLATTEDDWVQKISTLINNPHLRWELGNAGHQYVLDNYDMDKETTQWSEVYKELCQSDCKEPVTASV